MLKCFLSHSSKNKTYVRTVSNYIRADAQVFDELTFEAGQETKDEILNGLNESSIFVIFISNEALDSDWVRFELEIALERRKEKSIVIFPIIIDNAIKHNDKRIPEWIRNNTNIQLILKPTVAANKINNKLRELIWKQFPIIEERENIFVGRNSLVNDFEIRIHELYKLQPLVFWVSGIPSIGRKTFLKYSLKKCGIIRQYSELHFISLASTDGIEDFILKIEDLGITFADRTTNLMSISMDEKIELLINLLEEIFQSRERFIIEDNDSILDQNSNMVDWFQTIVNYFHENYKNKSILFLVISKRRVYRRSISISKELFYFTELPELDKNERIALLQRYASTKEVTLEQDDVLYFKDILTGFPEQVFYTIDQIQETSLFETKKNSFLIQQYASDKARVILDSLVNKKDELSIIYLLAKFEFISFSFLFELVDENKYYPIIQRLLNMSICERLCSDSSYIRLNEVFSDYINRNNFEVDISYIDKMHAYANDFIQNYDDDNRDISEYLFSMQYALNKGIEVDEKMLLPSYFLKTIKSLYQEKKYNDAIIIANRVLQNSSNIHIKMIIHVRFILCQSLARIKDKRFFEEVNKIQKPEYYFLNGFYQRISGRHDIAIRYYNDFLKEKPEDFRALSELSLIYSQNEEFDKAFSLAKKVYLLKQNNSLNTNIYVNCLLYKHNDKGELPWQEIDLILNKLKTNISDRAQEIYYSLQAKVVAKRDQDSSTAFAIIEKAIIDYNNSIYPLLSLADLALQFRNLSKLEKALELLTSRSAFNNQHSRSYHRYKAQYLVDAKKAHFKPNHNYSFGLLCSNVHKIANQLLDKK